MIFAEGEVLEAEDLELNPLNSEASSDGAPSGRTLREVERESILAALQRWEGNRSRAAVELGISRRTIINKIQEYGLEDEGKV